MQPFFCCCCFFLSQRLTSVIRDPIGRQYETDLQSVQGILKANHSPDKMTANENDLYTVGATQLYRPPPKLIHAFGWCVWISVTVRLQRKAVSIFDREMLLSHTSQRGN